MFPKGIVAAGVLCVVCAAGYFLYRSNQSPLGCDSIVPAPTIIAVGDSLVEGYGAPKGEGFVEKLSARIGVPIQNYGKSGDTSAQGLARAKEPRVHPDIVLILLGGNDALQKVPLETTKQNLSSLIEHFQSFQSKRTHVILIGVMGGFPSDPFSQMFKDLAKQYGVTYVPNILSGLFGNQAYMSDQVHPNAVGYGKIAERLETVLRAECKSIRK